MSDPMIPGPQDDAHALEMRIVHALEQPPQVRIPQDFAARVTAAIPPRAVRLRQLRLQAQIPARRVGYTVAAVCMVAAAIAMLALAPHADQKTLYLTLECLLASQFCLLAAWLALPRND
jgi:hypothetical protein